MQLEIIEEPLSRVVTIFMVIPKGGGRSAVIGFNGKDLIEQMLFDEPVAVDWRIYTPLLQFSDMFFATFLKDIVEFASKKGIKPEKYAGLEKQIEIQKDSLDYAKEMSSRLMSLVEKATYK